MSLTAQRLVEDALDANPDRTAVVDGERRASYSELANRSARLANVLLSLGASSKRPVTALLGNRLEFIELDVACTRAGITRIGVNERLSADEASYILEHSGSAVFVTTTELRKRFDVLPNTIEAVLLVDSTGEAQHEQVPKSLDYEEALTGASPQLDVAPVTPETPNYILYTSGTTGRPKGATHTHGSRFAATMNMLASEFATRSRTVMVHVGPLTHGSGSKVITVLALGGTNVILNRFDIDSFATTVEREGGTHTFLVPTMLQRLVESNKTVKAAIRTLEQVTFGGSPIASSTFAAALVEFGPLLTQVYGSAEAPHPVTVLTPREYAGRTDDRLLASAGRSAFGVEISIVNELETEVDPGTVGELLVRGPSVMAGYWHDNEATDAAFTPGGWYRTGDLASRDPAGIVAFHDRKRDLIISGGLNVYPNEVERVLQEHPGVQLVAVVGYPDDEWGESILAYVVPTADWSPSEPELVEWARSRLASYKKPRRVEFLDELPLGSSNKVLKRELRDRLWEGRGRKVN
jgi:acyl-CoA synthetase (AMP-forming)/AMP-acid ligase II